mgnify:CR=1 FL=1
MMNLSPLIRLRVWLRLFLLQGSWNFERLQGLGFFFALYPALQKLYRDEQLQQVCREHAGYFNTHPFLAPSVAGAVLEMEQRRSRNEEQAVNIQDFKEMVAAPYAAVGDAMFWGGLRPLTAGIAILFAVKGIILAPLIFLLLFNLLPFWFRIFGFIYGYRNGIRSLEFLQQHRLPDWAIRIKETAVVLLGGVSAFLVFQQLQAEQIPKGLGFLAIPLVLILALCARRGISTLLLVLLTTAIIICLSLFGFEPTAWL